jgi:hypothetical protein
VTERPDPSGLPAPLHALPVEPVEKWSISHDVERDLVMEATSVEELQEIVSIFTDELFEACNAFLDTDPPEAEWLLWVLLPRKRKWISSDALRPAELDQGPALGWGRGS